MLEALEDIPLGKQRPPMDVDGPVGSVGEMFDSDDDGAYDMIHHDSDADGMPDELLIQHGELVERKNLKTGESTWYRKGASGDFEPSDAPSFKGPVEGATPDSDPPAGPAPDDSDEGSEYVGEWGDPGPRETPGNGAAG